MMKTAYLLIVAFVTIISSCSDNKQVTTNPYASLGDTVPTKEFEPTGKDSISSDTIKLPVQIDTIATGKAKK